MLFVLSAIIYTMNLCAQDKQGKVPYMTKSDVSKYVVVDTARIRIWYALNALDIHDEDSYIDLQVLEVGSKLHKYYSHFVWESDSLITAYQRHHRNGNYPSQLAPRGRGGRGYWSEMQFHTWLVEDGRVRTYTREPDALYNGYYDEPYPAMQWMLTTDTATICNYPCQRATCHYHGRDFEAWFTPEVPMQVGPWKLGGLPGLILKVYDADMLYTFECVRMEEVRQPIWSHPYDNHRPIKREKVLKFERKVNEDAHRVLGWTRMEGQQPLPVRYEPIELE